MAFEQNILINWSPQETRVAIVEAGVVQELYVERRFERGLVGNIYNGKVVRVLPGMQSAFIDIGLERSAFLHVADLCPEVTLPLARRANDQPVPIEKRLHEGQTLMVQVLKDPIGSKGARLSSQISVAGRMLVFLPQDEHIGISQKIESLERREELRERLSAITQAISQEDGRPQGGYILRTNGEEASNEELRSDILYLRKTWASVRDMSFNSPAGTLLYQELNLCQRVLRDLVNENTQSIRIDSQEQFEVMKAFGEAYTPSSLGKLDLYRGENPVFDLYNIDLEIERALAGRVELKSGGYLIIDQTEALTTVDVNTGGYVGARNFDDTIFKTNLEAAQTIARQLRLRNLGGIIIIDFIDMSQPEHQEAVLAELNKQMDRDRTKKTLSGFSALGLVEMTRKRTRESLAHILCHPCPTCDSRGQVKTVRTVCYDILREILREAKQFNPREFRVVACANVVEMLLDEENTHLAGLRDFIGKPISLQVEPSLSPEKYDIVLI